MSTKLSSLPGAAADGDAPHRPPANIGYLSAAVLFAAYPALRPYSTETGLPGASAFGSDRWILAHTLGMAAFALLAAGVCTFTGRRALRRAGLAGTALVLPYYGAEAFGLHALGLAAQRRHDGSVTAISDLIRNNVVALVMFGLGLTALALVGVGIGRLAWRHSRVAAVLVSVGLVTYLPQFFGPPWLRVLHGGVLALGLGLLAVTCPTVVDDVGQVSHRRSECGRPSHAEF